MLIVVHENICDKKCGNYSYQNILRWLTKQLANIPKYE